MQADNEREFDDFARGSARRLAQLATLLTDDRHLAQDLVQSALAKAYVHWGRARDNPLPYVRRIMVNQRTDWWRRRRDREVLTAEHVHRAAPGDFTAGHAQRDEMVQALRALTAKERAAVVLRYFEDLTEAQIAAELAVAPGTVKSTLSRALTKLRVSPELTLALTGDRK